MWVEITEEDLLTVLAGAELSGYRSAATAAGQEDPVEPTMRNVTNLVRGYVGGCRNNTLGEGLTIPEKLLAPALDILAVSIPKRVGKNPTQVRKEAHDAAIKLLEQVAACKFDIEEPETATEETSGGQRPASEARCNTHQRSDQDGI